MNKKISFFLLCFAISALVARTQTPPPPTGNGGSSSNSAPSTGSPPTPSTGDQVQALSVKPPMSWYCDIEFYYKGKSYYSESLEYGDTEAYRGSLSSKVDNKLDSVYWEGTRCYCWVVVYQSKYWKGLNLGLWLDSESGSYDLNKYITYDWNDQAWEPWDKTVSSYAIYCY